ncbi:hypothetical protein ACOSQ2_024346 [Xanthoceras sorbifolium]
MEGLIATESVNSNSNAMIVVDQKRKISLDSGMATKKEQFSVSNETKSIKAEVAGKFLEAELVGHNIAITMERLEGTNQKADKVVLDQAGLVGLGLNEPNSTPNKTGARKWKRAARKGPGSSALSGIPSLIQRILSARKIAKRRGWYGSLSPLQKSPSCKVNLHFSPTFVDSG